MIFYRQIAPIKAMTFDLDDTLYDNHPLLVIAEKQLSEFMHQSYPKSTSISLGKWRKIKTELLQQQPELASDMGELRKRTLRQGLQESGYHGAQLDEATLACFERFYFYRSNFIVDENIHATLDALAQKVPLVAITNGNVNLAQIGIQKYFDVCFKANLRSPMKPHPHMFKLAQQHFNLPPENILHVGDNFEKDIKGALDAGFQTAWHACNRTMLLNAQKISVLPHLSVTNLNHLLKLV